jgi:hypothetical protein
LEDGGRSVRKRKLSNNYAAVAVKSEDEKVAKELQKPGDFNVVSHRRLARNSSAEQTVWSGAIIMMA